MENIQKHAPKNIAVRNSGSCRAEDSTLMFPKVVLKAVIVCSDKEIDLTCEKPGFTTVVIWELLGKPE